MFSAFVPESGIFLIPFNWGQIFLPIFLIPRIFWVTRNQLSSLLRLALNAVEAEVKAVLPAAVGMVRLFSGIFAFIVLINFSGLSPYIFTASSHLRFTLRLALPI